MHDPFDTTKKDGTPRTCKFCHEPVWWHTVLSRWYNVGGETLHVETCEKRRKFYHDKAMDARESVRQKRAR